MVVNSWMLRGWDPHWTMSWALGRQDKEEEEAGCWCHGFLGRVESPVTPAVKACVS